MVQTGGSFTNNGTYAVVSGSTGGGSSLSVDAGRLTNFSGTTLTGGTYEVISSSPANTSTLSFGGGTITTNAATVLLSGASTVFNEINGLAVNQGTFAITNGRNFTTLGTLSNSGLLYAGNSSVLTALTGLTQSGGGMLAGMGTVVSTTLALSGAIAPGGTFNATGGLVSGPGTLTVNGITMLASDTALEFELGAANFTSSDHLDVVGAFTLDGTLDVTALAGFGAGRYDLIDYAGLFINNGLDLGTLPAGYTYSIDTTIPGQVDLVVTAVVPEPGTWVWLAGGMCALAGCLRRRRNGRRVAA